MKKRLAIVTTHPIQYNAPLFELLHSRKIIDIRVFYTWGDDVMNNKFDPDFGKVINWDLDLMNGYQFEFIPNVAIEKGSHHYNGIDNPTIISVIESFNPDGILIYGWPFKSHMKVMRHFKGKIPVFFRGDSTMLDNKNGLRDFIRMLFLKWVYRYIDKALFAGISNRAYFKKMGLKEVNLCMMPHAVDNFRFRSGQLEIINAAADYRKKLDLKTADFVFLFAGKFEGKKDPLGLIEAFLNAQLSSRYHLVMVGNGVLEEKMRSLATGSQQIHFLPFVNQSQMPAIYEMSDTFILPSVGPGESWGLAVNEAMANAKPVIVSDKCGCAADLVQQGVNGFIFKAGDTKQLAMYLKEITASASLVKKMGKASADIIESHSFEMQATIIENLLTI